MNRKMFTRALAAPFLMAMVMSVTTTSSAFAADVKTYPAQLCVKEGFNQGELSVGAFGEISNQSTTSALKVTCPIVRDDFDGGFPVSAFVTVKDLNPGAAFQDNFVCAFTETNISHQHLNIDNRSTTGTTSGAFQVVGFGPFNNTNSAAYYRLTCSIPRAIPNPANPNAKITSSMRTYTVTENGDTNIN
jgi:hypothetical protein